jgi:hypothetical protein
VIPTPRLLLAGLLLGLAASVALPAPAGAHPFGDPQTLALTEDGDAIVVRWQVGGLDDLTLLGVALGTLPNDRVFLDGAVDVREGDPAALAADPAFTDYLTERIQVAVRGEPCPLRVADLSDLAGEGARLVAGCPADGEVELTSTMLTDLHPAYQLLATGPDGQRARYDVDHPTHTWILGAAGDDTTPTHASAGAGLGRSAAVQIGAVLAGGALLTIAAVAVRRRTRRTERAA